MDNEEKTETDVINITRYVNIEEVKKKDEV